MPSSFIFFAFAERGGQLRGFEILFAGFISYVGLLTLGLIIWGTVRALGLALRSPAGWAWQRLDYVLVQYVAPIAGLSYESPIKRWSLFVAAFAAFGAVAATAPLPLPVVSIACAGLLAFAVYRRWQAVEGEHLDQIPDWRQKIHGERGLQLETIFATALIFFYAPIGFERLSEADGAAFRRLESSVTSQQELGPLNVVVGLWDRASKILPGRGIAEVALYTWAQALKGLPIIDYAEIYGVELAPLEPNDDNARHATMAMRALLDLLLLATLGQVLAIRANVRAGRDTRDVERALRRGSARRVRRLADTIATFGMKGIIRPAELAARACASADGLKHIRQQQLRGSARFELAFAVTSVARQNGLPGLLGEAVAAYRLTLKEWARERVPLDWAEAQNDLGIALSDLGDMLGREALIEEAIVAYREALKERRRGRVPLYWAETQNNLGVALADLGEIRGSEAMIEEAIAVYSDALKEWTRERVPRDWAMTQNNLGNALSDLGNMLGSDELIGQAIVAYREALKERIRETMPLDWAETQNNLGVALSDLGDMLGSEELIEDAIAAYREALQEWTRERVPLDWARTKNNLGVALADIGRMRGSEALLREAIAACREALREWTRERVPASWAMTQNNLGNALCDLGDVLGSEVLIEDGIAAYREALMERTRERAQLDWAATQKNLGNALLSLGRMRRDIKSVMEAIDCFEGAFEVYRRLNRLRDAKEISDLLDEARAFLQELQGGPIETATTTPATRLLTRVIPFRTPSMGAGDLALLQDRRKRRTLVVAHHIVRRRGRLSRRV